jgi:hypothetical protein
MKNLALAHLKVPRGKVRKKRPASFAKSGSRL